jgi:hypothetical protein
VASPRGAALPASPTLASVAPAPAPAPTPAADEDAASDAADVTAVDRAARRTREPRSAPGRSRVGAADEREKTMTREQ